MSGASRLNGLISCFERGTPAFAAFSRPDVESAISFSAAGIDGVIIETEHVPWDAYRVRDYLQYLLARRQIVESGSLSPAVTPLVRVPANGAEMNQFFAKQALDLGAYGIVWPHVSTVEQAYNAVAACRYPRRTSAELYEPAGLRGDGPAAAVRYWGLTQQEYYRRADVWPLDPDGELLVVLMCEDLEGIDQLDRILSEVPGIGAVLVGEGDLSQELGYPRQYEHPEVLDAIDSIVSICQRHGVVVGHPHATRENVERLLHQGFQLLFGGVETAIGAVEAGRALLAPE